jgi:group I intron endonuclease
MGRGRPNFCGVYCLINIVSNRVYVGSGVDVNSRLSEHFRELRQGVHKNRHLQASFNKHGLQSFGWFVLERCDFDVKYDREQFWIDTFAAVDIGYNIRPRADFKSVNEETKKRISIALKKRKFRMPDHVKAAISAANLGRSIGPHSLEWRTKVSIALTGRKRPEFSAEWKRNMARPCRFRAVECFTLDGKSVGKFSKAKDAAALLTGGRVTGIYQCLNGHAKTAYGFLWKPISSHGK